VVLFHAALFPANKSWLVANIQALCFQ